LSILPVPLWEDTFPDIVMVSFDEIGASTDPKQETPDISIVGRSSASSLKIMPVQ